MEYVKLGDTGLEVSRICFGTWQYGGEWGTFEKDDALSAIRKAREAGINFFDTAQAYGFGQAEEVLAEGLGDELKSKRDDLVIATKGGLRPEENRDPRDASEQWLRSGLEQSLEHLGLEYVDIYQVHWPDADTPAEETAEILDQFVEEGKARFAGVSNYNAGQMKAFQEHRKLDTLQPAYHMFRRDIEAQVLPYCREHGIGVLIYSPLAHGLLTGKYTFNTDFPEDDWRSSSDVFEGQAFKRNLGVVDDLQDLATLQDLSLPQLAVAWTLAHPAVHCAIVGARNPEQIAETAQAGDMHLDEDTLNSIETLLEKAAPVGGPTPE